MTIPGIGILGATASGGRRQRAPVPEGWRLAAWLGPCPAGALHREQAEAPRYQQAREPLCPQTSRSWRAIMLRSSGSNPESSGRLACRAAKPDAPEQGRCRTRRQDRAHCPGYPDLAWSALRTKGPCIHLTLTGRFARLGNSDDETVDQHAVSPLQKSWLRARTIYWERRARISSWRGCNSSPLARGRIHHATGTVVDDVANPCTDGADPFRGRASETPSRRGEPSNCKSRHRSPPACGEGRDRNPRLMLLQDPDEFLFREAAALHVLVLSFGARQIVVGNRSYP